MPRVTFNRMSTKRATTRKRRTSVITRARYAKKTVSTNRSLIKSNAYALRAVKRMLPSPTYCDFQYSGILLAENTNAPLFTSSYVSAPLMYPSFWGKVLRQDANVNESSSTIVKRMQLNMRYSLQQSNWCQITSFVVSIRKDAAGRDLTNLVEGDDYIYSSGDQFCVRLNPAVLKCHYARNITLTKGALFDEPPTVGSVPLATSPGMTFAKGQVNMNLNFRLRQPLGTPWQDMKIDQLVPSQRIYLLTFITSETTLPGDNPVEIGFDALFTTFNAS